LQLCCPVGCAGGSGSGSGQSGWDGGGSVAGAAVRRRGSWVILGKGGASSGMSCSVGAWLLLVSIRNVVVGAAAMRSKAVQAARYRV